MRPAGHAGPGFFLAYAVGWPLAYVLVSWLTS